MAKPTDVITWATDAAFAADGDAWGGDANKVDPGASRRAEGAEPDTFPAVWFNYVLNGIGNVLTWLLARFDSTGQVLLEATTVFQRYTAAIGCDLPGSWSVIASDLAGAHILSTVNSAEAWWDVTRNLPRQSSIVRVSALVKPGAARAASSRMAIEFYTEDYGSTASPTVGVTLVVSGDSSGTGHAEDDGTTNVQWITLDYTASPVSVSADDVWTLMTRAGNDGATNQDKIYAILIEFQTTVVSND